MEDDSDSNNPCHHPSISIRVNRACLRSAQSTAGVLFCACFWVAMDFTTLATISLTILSSMRCDLPFFFDSFRFYSSFSERILIRLSL